MRARSRVQNNDLQLDLFTASLPAYRTIDALQSPDRETLSGIPTDSRPEFQSQAQDAGKVLSGVRSNAAPVDVIALDTAAKPRPGIGEGADATDIPPVGAIADNIVILPCR